MRPRGLMNFDYGKLDPGVCRLVRWLHDHGYVTSDSGDGKTKFEENKAIQRTWKDDPSDAELRWDEETLLSFPHVAIPMNKSRLVAGADELKSALHLIGIEVVAMSMEGDDGPLIEATYDPATGTALLMLMNVTDAMLPEWIR